MQSAIKLSMAEEPCNIREGCFGIFSDYLYDYFLSKVAVDDIRDVFDYYRECGKGVDIEMVDICDKLFVNDFNLTQAADDLFLHKNTLIYSLRNMRSFSDRCPGKFSGKGSLNADILCIERISETSSSR